MSESLTEEVLKKSIAKMKASRQGFEDGRTYDMSEPREPRFEDDFDVDTDPPEQYEISEEAMRQELTLYDIARNKAHAYAQEYNPSTGRVEDKPNYHALKQGYQAGFLEGFAHRLTNNTGE